MSRRRAILSGAIPLASAVLIVLAAYALADPTGGASTSSSTPDGESDVSCPLGDLEFTVHPTYSDLPENPAATHHDAFLDAMAEDFPSLSPATFVLVTETQDFARYAFLNGLTQQAYVDLRKWSNGWAEEFGKACQTLLGPHTNPQPNPSAPTRDLTGED